ncbi:hypothetical protein CTAYLR_008961 [Chrysophaeum taylorii]|uniref:DJ-1/PfpI domain-containing protein n=1 Tax=Chrysophaeum taylorii TaxID=2483200 RepID=A0AAD7UN75_9STRA|nr:hypothetical protein CTAYLR_008961 [Chrysophaeum taylorii]
MGKILMVFTSVSKYPDGSPTGWYLPEAAHPYEKFIAAGHAVDLVSISGTTTCDPSSIEATKEDASCVKFLAEVKTEVLPALATVDVLTYDCIFFVGGFGTMWDFPQSPAVQAAILKLWTAGKIVAAVCHGPCALMNVVVDGEPLVKGKEVTAFTNAEENVMNKYDAVSKPTGPGSCEDVLGGLGATFKDGGVFKPMVCVAGNLYTGQNPPSAGPLADEINKALAA